MKGQVCSLVSGSMKCLYQKRARKTGMRVVEQGRVGGEGVRVRRREDPSSYTYIYLPCRKTTAGWICDICHLFPVYLLYLSASIQWNHRIPLEHYAVSIYSRMAAPFFTNENWITSINKRHSTGAHRPRQDTDIASIMMDVIICILYIGMYKYITLYCM